jgi:hypothetical protein
MPLFLIDFLTSGSVETGEDWGERPRVLLTSERVIYSISQHLARREFFTSWKSDLLTFAMLEEFDLAQAFFGFGFGFVGAAEIFAGFL